MNPTFLAIMEMSWVPLGLGALGGLVAIGLWLVAPRARPFSIHLRFLAAVASTWLALCLAYATVRPADLTFVSYLMQSALATEVIAAVGTLFYLGSLVTVPQGERRWRQSSALLAGVTLMGSAFVRAAYQPTVTLTIEAPLAVVFIATVWRFRAEPLVYLAILGVTATVVLGTRQYLAITSTAPAAAWVTSTTAGVSLAMVLVAALLGLVKRQENNVKWYRQGFMIVPLAASSLAAMGAGYVAVWYGVSWHTAWALGAWWAVLLVSSIGLRQPDLFGFSSMGAGLAAVAAFAVSGAGQVMGYWGRYPTVLLVIALGAALLSAFLKPILRRRPTFAFAKALYLAGAVIAMAALAVEPFDTTPKYLGVDLLLAAAVLALAHAHRAPSWVNYLLAGLITGGVAPLAHLSLTAPAATWHHRFIQVTAGAAVAWLVVALVLREVLRRTASDRAARRHTLPLSFVGMGTTIVLAAYLGVQEVRTYAQFLTTGTSATLDLLGPGWGLAGWGAVLLACLLSMWLVRHTARTFLFYLSGIAATLYLGLFSHTDDLYRYLLYAIGGYGSAHLLVYLYEEKFMRLLSKTCALYREERRASTTIFTLAVISCFTAAILAIFRINTPPALLMLAILSGVFLAWAFIWMRGEMLYPAVFMVTLMSLAIWHNAAQPTSWDAGRLAINALILTAWGFVWLGVGKALQGIRGVIFQLAAPARACAVILGFVATGFATAMAVSPTFGEVLWRQPRTAWDWTLGVAALVALMGLFTWARFAFGRRFYGLMSGFVVLLLGLYVGLYAGMYIGTKL